MSTPYLNACLNYLLTDVDTLFKDMFTLYLKKYLNENRVFDVMLKYFFNMFRMTQNGSKCIQRVKKLKTLKYFPEEILTLFNLTHLCTNFVLVTMEGIDGSLGSKFINTGLEVDFCLITLLSPLAFSIALLIIAGLYSLDSSRFFNSEKLSPYLQQKCRF